jgi:hypothetical protein
MPNTKEVLAQTAQDSNSVQEDTLMLACNKILDDFIRVLHFPVLRKYHV